MAERTQLCGSCDAGLPMACTCPEVDPPALIVRAQVAEEIAQAIEAAADNAPGYALTPYQHAAYLARQLRVPDCGHQYHGADGGPCPRCGFDPHNPAGATRP